MTTIAYDGFTLAVDSQLTIGSLITYENKLWPWSKGVFSVAGNWCDYPFAEEWLEDQKSEAKFLKRSTLVWSEGKKVYYTDGPSVFKAKAGMSWGDGSHVAYGALAAGADAVEAVKIACKCNKHTGGKVRSFIVR